MSTFDEYSDALSVVGGTYGVALNFLRSNPDPALPESMVPSQKIGSIRMSLEHFKVMAYTMNMQVTEIEKQLGAEIPVFFHTLNVLHIAPEDWARFWKK